MCPRTNATKIRPVPAITIFNAIVVDRAFVARGGEVVVAT